MQLLWCQRLLHPPGRVPSIRSPDRSLKTKTLHSRFRLECSARNVEFYVVALGPSLTGGRGESYSAVPAGPTDVLDTDKQCDTVSTSGLRRLRQALHWRGSVRAAEIPVMCTHPACVGDPPAHVGELGPSSFGGQIPVQAE
jgi:hypothetical protein